MPHCGFDRNVVNTLTSDVRGPSYTPVVQWAEDSHILHRHGRRIGGALQG